MSEEVKAILLSLNVGCDSFFCFLDGKVKSYDLGGDDTIYGCMTLTDNDGIIRDIRVLVPNIVDEKTMCINIHEFTHAYQIYLRLGTLYDIDVEKSEEEAREKEAEYLKLIRKSV